MPGPPDYDGVCRNCGADEYVCSCGAADLVSAAEYYRPGNGLCEPLIPSKVPDLRGVPLGVLPAPGGDEGPTFGSAI
jgi:hypothetical protein